VDPSRLETIAREAGLAGAPSEGPAPPLEIDGDPDPILASRFHLGEVAATALGLSARAAGLLWIARGGRPQTVSVDTRAATATLLGFLLQRIENGPDLSRHVNPVTGLYRAADGVWIHLHGGFPHLARGAARLLGSAMEAPDIARRVASRSAADWEDALAEAGLCGAAVRSRDVWEDHPQGRALAALPVVEVERIADADPRPLPPRPSRPLEGVRVLDLTRVLAGPTCGRTLAMHGADVLRIGAPDLPSIEPFVIETGRGKRNAFLDLDRSEDRERLQELIRGADVVCRSDRGAPLDRRGLSPAELASLRPGVVAVSVSCYGESGPWRGRPGWEQLAQSVVGIAAAEGGDGPPRLAPAAATDYTTGYLAAYGAVTALARRAVEGGSWHVRVSLCQTGMWLARLGADRDPERATGLGDVQARFLECDTAWGRLAHLGPGVVMSETPPRWERPPAPLGSSAPDWAS